MDRECRPRFEPETRQSPAGQEIQSHVGDTTKVDEPRCRQNVRIRVNCTRYLTPIGVQGRFGGVLQAEDFYPLGKIKGGAHVKNCKQ